MLKVLLVDDEYYFRQALKVSLPWNELGFDICGEARNGEDALEKIEQLNPEIALVDINMPIMDGLQLVQCLKERESNIKIIILTGYGEFDYAKQAVQMGVKNYLLKPVNEEELKESLLTLRKAIEREASLKFEMESLKKQVKESIPVFRDRFLHDLLHGNMIQDSAVILEKARALGLDLSHDMYQVVILEPDAGSLSCPSEDKALWKFAVSNIACEVLGHSFRCYSLVGDQDLICILLNFERGNAGSPSETLPGICDEIRRLVSKYLKFTVTIAVGNAFESPGDIPSSYKEALFALRNKLLVGDNSVIAYSMISDSDITGVTYSVEHRAQMLMSMRLFAAEEVHGSIGQIFKSFRLHNTHPHQVFITCIELVSTCLEFITENRYHYKEVYSGSFNPFEEIQAKKTLPELEAWVRDIFSGAIEYIRNKKMTKSGKTIDEIKKYIDEHYHHTELRIDDIAKHVYLNYSHLCYIFKKETGATLNEYITDLRIKKAKELIDAGTVMIAEVASRVGYEDSNYFSKCFKKMVGLSPSQYMDLRKK